MDIGHIRIVILDYHTLVRKGLRLLLESQQGMEVVGESGSLSEGLDIVAKQTPDIILLEMNLSGASGMDVISSLLKIPEQGRLILVTAISDPQVHHQAVEEGVMGVVLKSHQPETLLKAIQKVNAGEVWLERSLIANVLYSRSRSQTHQNTDPDLENISQLSERERQVIQMIGQGYKNKIISTQLYITETTVQHHLSSIYRKLGVSDRLELLVFAHRYGLVTSSKK